MNNFNYTKNILLNKTKMLSALLKERNNQTGNYYEDLSEKISKASSENVLKIIAHEIIISSGKIEDLANLNYKEKNILEEVFFLSKEFMDNSSS